MKHVILGGRANGLAIARALHREGLESHVFEFGARAVCSASKAVAYFYQPPANDEAITSLLLDISSNGGAIVYSTDDRWNAYMTRNRIALQGAGVRFPFSSSNAIDLAADKLALTQAIAGIVDVPETHEYIGEALSAEQIVKPRFPFTGFVIRKKGAAAREVGDGHANGEAFIVQRRIVSPLRQHLSLCGVRIGNIVGALTFAKVLEYPHPGGTSTLSVVDLDTQLRENLLEKTERLLAHIDYRGPFEVEFIRCRRTGLAFVVDVNLRFWLQHELGRLLDVDYAKIYRQWLLGESVEVPKMAWRRAAWVHEGFPLSLLSDWRNSVVALGSLVSRRWLLAHWRLTDPGPFWRFLGG